MPTVPRYLFRCAVVMAAPALFACGNVAQDSAGPGNGSPESGPGMPLDGSLLDSGSNDDAAPIVLEPSAATCSGVCCPSDPTCYGNGIGGIGDECLAQRDNSLTGPTPDRLQFRQAWMRDTVHRCECDIFDNVFATGSSLPWPECHQGIGVGAPSGLMQLVDMDLSGTDIAEHTSRIGQAPFIAPTELAGILENGLCMVQGDVFDPEWALPPEQMSPTTDWPPYLPAPMPQPWSARPVTAKRRTADFDVASEREELLAEVSERGTDGVFFFDERRAETHSYWPLIWMALYSGSRDVRVVFPLREAETQARMNDPFERSCIGAFRGDALPAGTCIDTSSLNPQWGCYADECAGGQSPATIKGYVLIVELEQVWSNVLMSTLCVSYPTAAVSMADGFAGDWGNFCRGSPLWNPTVHSGLPHGDWCASTNSPATEACHDAFRFDGFQVFQAFPVMDTTCGL